MIVLLLYEMDFYYRNYFLFISRRSMYCIKNREYMLVVMNLFEVKVYCL